MQYLKDDVKQNIIAAALVKFKENGYQGASMRDIAAKANIVSGNIYRYFKNKEDLFESAVGPTYELMEMIKHQYKNEIVDKSIDLIDNGAYQITKEVTDRVIKVFSGHETEILILLDKSEGTQYSNAKENLKQDISDILRYVYLPGLKNKGREIVDEFILYVLSSSFVDGICLILRSSADDSVRINKLVDLWYYIIFYGLSERI